MVALPDELLENREDPALEADVRAAVAHSGRNVVAYDDDPTGVQAVHNIAVLASWSEEDLASELAGPASLFFVLTNSRSLPSDQASDLNRELTRNLLTASRRISMEFAIASRSDSTLRGHFPVETDAIAGQLGRVDGVLICPAFFEGGRYTIDDLHYLRQGDQLVPVAETEFARDATFGYQQSNLREWVQEKTSGRISASHVQSLSLVDIREGGPDRVTQILIGLKDGQPMVVNATCYRDLHLVTLGLIAAESAGKRFIYRTGASFVRARAGLSARPLLTRHELLGENAPTRTPGVVVVGSHVRRSGEQLEQLLQLDRIAGIDVDVSGLLESDNRRRVIIDTARSQMNEALVSDATPAIYTSRTVVGTGGQLDVSRAVSTALVKIVEGLETTPGFIIGKGGITSSDIGTKALAVRRAIVLGQIRAGVPVWRLGPESRFPGMPYVVFPGNVGAPETLAEIVAELRGDTAM
jgi:uncharacterized protein YgbK (DUF1537 family)